MVFEFAFDKAIKFSTVATRSGFCGVVVIQRIPGPFAKLAFGTNKGVIQTGARRGQELVGPTIKGMQGGQWRTECLTR